MRSDINADVYLSEIVQLRDDLNDLGEVVSNERLTTIILDEVPQDVYSTIKRQSTALELSASTLTSGRLQPRTRGGGAERWNKGRNISW